MPLVNLKDETGKQTIVQTAMELREALAIIGLTVIARYKETASLGQIMEVLYTPNPDVKNFLDIRVRSVMGINYYLFEDTIATGGTTIAQLNPNREGVNDIGIGSVSAPTITDDGTLLISGAGGSKKDDFDWQVFDGEETIVPDRNKKYLIRIESTDADNDITIKLTAMISQE